MNLTSSIKNLFSSQEPDKFEQLLRQHCVYTPEQLEIAPIRSILKGQTLEYIGEGLNARVFKIKDKGWVVKEGKWDVKVDFRLLKLPLPGSLMEKVSGLFKFVFLPRKRLIENQYRDYLTFAGYFGYFPDDETYFHPDREMLFNLQRNIRDSLLQYVAHVEQFFDIKLPERVLRVLASDVRYHNFLPQEYLLVGSSLSRENDGKTTYFIIQRFIKGKLMHDVELQSMPKSIRHQLVLFAYLELLMCAQLDMIPDTRPRTPAESFNWLTKTDNIIVTPQKGLIFIDTRWMWRLKSNLIARGFIIPELSVNQAKELLTNFPIAL